MAESILQINHLSKAFGSHQMAETALNRHHVFVYYYLFDIIQLYMCSYSG